MQLHGSSLVSGSASGPILFSNTALSFWGGVDPATGEVVDRHHSLCGRGMKGCILAIPCGRGSCSGSVAILELILNGNAPAALVFSSREEILTAGVIIAKELLEKHIPILVLEGRDFALLDHERCGAIHGDRLVTGDELAEPPTFHESETTPNLPTISMSPKDEEVLDGNHGRAAAVAMKVLLEFAQVQGARELVNVTQSHLDSCLYIGPASLIFVEHLLKLGDAKFAVPTSMNSISIDQQRWKALAINEDFAERSNRLANIYVNMGATPTFTCAPYVLDTAPKTGQHIGWGESNAVVFANSVLGACTQKYPDLIDVCIALTGRAPLAGCHLSEGRLPSIVIQVSHISSPDDSFWPVLGYCAGNLSQSRIPLLMGLENNKPSISDLKAFGAAFATTSSAPMFHIRGTTPGHCILKSQMTRYNISTNDLKAVWEILNTANDDKVQIIALGNPHFSFDEFCKLSALVSDKKASKSDSVRLMITTNREVYQEIFKSGIVGTLSEFGAELITDTCWCMIKEPTIATSGSGNIMTNSAKYAHYAPGLVSRKVHFGSLSDCVNVCITGSRRDGTPEWLR